MENTICYIVSKLYNHLKVLMHDLQCEEELLGAPRYATIILVIYCVTCVHAIALLHLTCLSFVYSS